MQHNSPAGVVTARLLSRFTATRTLGVQLCLMLLALQTPKCRPAAVTSQHACSWDDTHEDLCLPGATQLGSPASSVFTAQLPAPGLQAFLQSFSTQCGDINAISSHPQSRAPFASASHVARQSSSRTATAHATAASQPQAAESSPSDSASSIRNDAAVPSGSSADGTPRLRLRCAAALIPHPDKEKTGGEDAYFISQDQLKFGVADGVGGWSLSGVNAGLYSGQLMRLAQQAADSTSTSPEAPLQILSEAYEGITVEQGSTTACVLCLHGEQIHAANVGDSGFMVIRGNEIVFKSPPQQHGFNFPYQLGPRARNYQTPMDAQLYSVAVREGDMIIAATDGVSDNLFPGEIAAVVATLRQRRCPPEVIARGLAHYARRTAEDTVRMSPFAIAARQQTQHKSTTGGKLDDIAVLYAECVAADKTPATPQSKM